MIASQFIELEASPNTRGEFESPLHGAVYIAIEYGIPQLPLWTKTKKPRLLEWQKLATTEVAQLTTWAEEYPNCNFGSMGTGAVVGGHVVFEFDGPDVWEDYERDTGEKKPETLETESSPGRGHLWFIATPESVTLGNDGNVVQDKSRNFSVRADREQCVTVGSIHPKTDAQYRLVSDVKPAPMPDTLAKWIRGRISQQKMDLPETDTIAEGSRNNILTSKAGYLRAGGFVEDEINYCLQGMNGRRCDPPLGQDEVETIAHSIGKKEAGTEGDRTLNIGAGKTYTETQKEERVADWRSFFRSVTQLDEGEVRMLIRGFLPEGVTFIGALPGEGKTLLALSITKALTTGRNFLGQPQFSVSETVPVIYLIPESGGRAFRRRCEKCGIPNDPNKFICRTISEGVTLALSDPVLQQAVRELKPVVILDTLVRFNEGDDENSAAQNRQVANDITVLRQLGAVAVIALHHATKALREKGMSLETVLRGTGDIGALPDAVYGLLQDDELYDFGSGPNQIDVKCVKPRDFDPPPPFRVAASRDVASPKSEGLVLRATESIIDLTGDLALISGGVSIAQRQHQVERTIKEFRTITIEELSKKLGITTWEARECLDRLGWKKPKGREGRWYQ